MADISTITLLNGDVVNLKDSAGREAMITGLSGKVDIAQGVQNQGKILKVSNGGVLELVDDTVGNGDVVGPNSAVDEHVATFDGTTGKLIQDSGFTIGISVPSDAVFTDTTYESKSASAGGTDVSLVTTGEKATWNAKYDKPSSGIPSTDLADGVIPDISGKIDKEYIVPDDCESKTWNGLASFYGDRIWTDGENVYYSYISNQYVLNKSTSTWLTKTWTGLTSFLGNFIWTDGENVYYSYISNQYVLNKSTSTWLTKTWTGLTSFNGSLVWTDGENIYYSNGSTQYVLDKSTSTWSAKTWTGLTVFNGNFIWTDGENIYYSYDSDQYILNKSTSTWSAKTWIGLTSFSGGVIWTDGENIYYSYDSDQYILNKSTSTWSKKTWSGLRNFDGNRIWTDGENIYCSNGSTQYKFNKPEEDKILIGHNGEFTATPISELELNFISVEEKGASNGIAELDSAGKVPSSQLPSYVDDVLEYASLENFPLTGESGKIYVAQDTNKTYRWGGSAYVEISESLALGETSATAYRGDRGAAAYAAAVTNIDSTPVENSTHLVTSGGVYAAIPDISGKLDKEYIVPDDWESKTWNGLTKFYGDRIWTDGENIYYSSNSDQYILNKSTSTWLTKTWTGLTNFSGTYVWTDGKNIYCSNSSTQYVLDKSTSTWSTKTWSGLTNFYGGNIWTDGENIYYSNGDSAQYVLDKSTSTWNAKTWTGLRNFSGQYIWTDGENVYYSYYGTLTYVLDKANSTWSTKTWIGLTEFYGNQIWTDGENIYCSNGSDQYILNKSTSTWNAKAWTGFTGPYGKYVWTDGENIYYNYGSNQYKFNKQEEDKILIGHNGEFTATPISELELNYVSVEEKGVSNGIAELDSAGKVPNSQLPSYIDKTYAADGPSNFSQSTQSGMPCLFNGSQHIWTDGENIYYSNKIEQYVLDKSTSTWIFKQWNGFNNITSRQPIWTDGENIYYSNNLSQYVLDKSTSTWSAKTWTGLTSFYGDHIWIDGENIYYSNNLSQYVLDKSTSAWSEKTWNGLTNFVGDRIWKDEDNVYYSNDTDQYVLDKSTSTWSTKTWNGYSPENGLYVWTDGENIYYSYNTKQYTLDKSTSTWSAKTWNGYSVMKADNIWKDGNTIYYSADVQYVLDKSTSTWVSKTWNGLISTDVYNIKYIWTDGENTYFSNGSIQYIFNKDTSSWSVKTWIGGSNKIMGDQIWSDGENIYCSNGTYQHIFDKSTSTWSAKTWTGLTNFYASKNIWTDGENFYYSNNENQYVLDKSTSTWSAKTWNGYSPASAEQIWTDGENIYYSNGSSTQYVLDKSTSTWNAKTWTGFTGSYGQYVWTDGENVYYSYYGTHKYVLDKANSAWITKKWSVNEFDGTMIWTDGENIYLDYAYKYSPTYVSKLLLGTDGEFSPVKAEKLVMVGATSSVAGVPGLVPAPTVNDSEKFLRGDGTWATPKVFIAEYGVTTFQELVTAKNNQCLVFCKVLTDVSNYRYAPISFISTAFAEFHYYKPANNNEVDEMYIYEIRSNNVWKTTTQEIIYNNVLEYGVSTWNDYETVRRNIKNKNQSNGVFLKVRNNSGNYRYVALSYTYGYNAEFNYYSSSDSANNPDKIVVYKLTKTNDEWSYTERTVKVDVMVGATSSANGVSGSVPAPTKADVNKFLAGDGTWKFGEAMTILSYGTSTWAEFLAAYQTNSVVYCRASSNSDPSSGSKTRLAFMAYVSAETNPTSVEFQYYRSVNGHSSSGMCDEVYIYKLQSNGNWSVTSRKAGIKEVAVGSFLTREYSSDKVTIDAKIKEITFTLKADSWSNATPPTQTVTATGVTSSSYILTEPSISITGTQYDAYTDGKIVRSAKATDTVTYKCLGAVPTVDIPMRIMVFKW